jgi:hypothetical protein
MTGDQWPTAIPAPESHWPAPGAESCLVINQWDLVITLIPPATSGQEIKRTLARVGTILASIPGQARLLESGHCVCDAQTVFQH